MIVWVRAKGEVTRVEATTDQVNRGHFRVAVPRPINFGADPIEATEQAEDVVDVFYNGHSIDGLLVFEEKV